MWQMRNWLDKFLSKLGFNTRRPILIGVDWILYNDGTIKMNYGGYQEPKWEDWQKKFCWLPKKIILEMPLVDPPKLSPPTVTKWVWLKTIYIRRRPHVSIVSKHLYFEYQYAENLFDLIAKEGKTSE